MSPGDAPGAGPGQPGGVAIDARALEKRYGRNHALGPLSFALPAASGLAVLGPNGAGKSTLLRLLAGLARPSAGRLDVNGRPAGHRASRAGLGYLGHATGLAPSLSVHENLLFAARLYGLGDPRARAAAALEREGLAPLADRRAGALSRGQSQRVAIARGLLHDPGLVLLDEPFTGLDRGAAAQLAAHLRGLRDGARSLVLVTHGFEEHVLELCDHALVLVAGRPAWFGALGGRQREFEDALARALGGDGRAHAGDGSAA